MPDVKLSDDMVEGYYDGLRDDRADFPDSLSNRSHSYRHGWLNGRDDRIGKARTTAADMRVLADLARAKDETS